MKRRILTFLLSAAMMLTSVNVPAYAAGTDAGSEPAEEVVIEETTAQDDVIPADAAEVVVDNVNVNANEEQTILEAATEEETGPEELSVSASGDTWTVSSDKYGIEFKITPHHFSADIQYKLTAGDDAAKVDFVASKDGKDDENTIKFEKTSVTKSDEYANLGTGVITGLAAGTEYTLDNVVIYDSSDKIKAELGSFGAASFRTERGTDLAYFIESEAEEGFKAYKGIRFDYETSDPSTEIIYKEKDAEDWVDDNITADTGTYMVKNAKITGLKAGTTYTVKLVGDVDHDNVYAEKEFTTESSDGAITATITPDKDSAKVKVAATGFASDVTTLNVRIKYCQKSTDDKADDPTTWKGVQTGNITLTSGAGESAEITLSGLLSNTAQSAIIEVIEGSDPGPVLVQTESFTTTESVTGLTFSAAVTEGKTDEITAKIKATDEATHKVIVQVYAKDGDPETPVASKTEASIALKTEQSIAVDGLKINTPYIVKAYVDDCVYSNAVELTIAAAEGDETLKVTNATGLLMGIKFDAEIANIKANTVIKAYVLSGKDNWTELTPADTYDELTTAENKNKGSYIFEGTSSAITPNSVNQ